MYITVRKSWNKHIHSHAPPMQVQKTDGDCNMMELNSLNQELVNVKAELETTKKINDELRAKVRTAVADINRHHRESEKILTRKDDENKITANSLKNCTSENKKLKGELQNLNKIVKIKDKEIYNLETYKYNNQEAVRNNKNDAKEQKTEKEKTGENVRKEKRRHSETKILAGKQ